MTNEDMTDTANHVAGGKHQGSRHIGRPLHKRTGILSLEVTDQLQFPLECLLKGGLRD